MEVYIPKERLFLEAAKEGNVEALESWLKLGVSIHTKDYMKRTALDLAVLNGKPAAVDFLATHKETTLGEIAKALDMLEVYRFENKAIKSADDFRKNTSFFGKVVDALFSWEGTQKYLDAAYESKKIIALHMLLVSEAEKRKEMPQKVASRAAVSHHKENEKAHTRS